MMRLIARSAVFVLDELIHSRKAMRGFRAPSFRDGSGAPPGGWLQPGVFLLGFRDDRDFGVGALPER